MKLWLGRILIIVTVLFMLLDAVSHIIKPAPVADAFARLGYPLSLGPVLGILVLVCVAIYVIPKTSVLGAILLTGYLGGATASQLRVGSLAFETSFPIVIGVLIWAGLFLTDDRLRTLIPFRR